MMISVDCRAMIVFPLRIADPLAAIVLALIISRRQAAVEPDASYSPFKFLLSSDQSFPIERLYGLFPAANRSPLTANPALFK
jgi:hypothetical protein